MLAYTRGIWDCRYFWLSLVKIDLRARYRRSVLGIGWSLLRPIAMSIILCLVFKRLFRPNDALEYGLYLIAGLCCWDYLTGATRQGCSCFFAGESYIRQHPAPLAIYPLRTALGESIHFLMALVVVIGLSWYKHNGFNSIPAMLSLIPTLILLFILAWSLALLAGFANVWFQDTQHLVDVGFQILFYATPIVYYPDLLGNGRLHKLVCYCNPMYPLIDLIRLPLTECKVPTLEMYQIACICVLVVSTLAMAVCARYQRYLIFHL